MHRQRVVLILLRGNGHTEGRRLFLDSIKVQRVHTGSEGLLVFLFVTATRGETATHRGFRVIHRSEATTKTLILEVLQVNSVDGCRGGLMTTVVESGHIFYLSRIVDATGLLSCA